MAIGRQVMEPQADSPTTPIGVVWVCGSPRKPDSRAHACGTSVKPRAVRADATADVGDDKLDSAVFLKAGSLDISATEVSVTAVAAKTRTRDWSW